MGVRYSFLHSESKVWGTFHHLSNNFEDTGLFLKDQVDQWWSIWSWKWYGEGRTKLDSSGVALVLEVVGIVSADDIGSVCFFP